MTVFVFIRNIYAYMHIIASLCITLISSVKILKYRIRAFFEIVALGAALVDQMII